MPQPSRYGDHLRMYGYPEEGPQLIAESVDEIEFHLRRHFPAVFETARLRNLAKVKRHETR